MKKILILLVGLIFFSALVCPVWGFDLNAPSWQEGWGGNYSYDSSNYDYDYGWGYHKVDRAKDVPNIIGATLGGRGWKGAGKAFQEFAVGWRILFPAKVKQSPKRLRRQPRPKLPNHLQNRWFGPRFKYENVESK